MRRFVGSNRLNPLPHAGTISVFLLGVVIVTGVYITLFFSFGFEASYRSVEKMHDHPIQTVIRTIHRYASAGLVVTTLVHAWRTFVAGRFGGPRRHRWVSGVVSLGIVWLAGVTGYWLVWDERAQALTEAAFGMFRGTGAGARFFIDHIIGPDAGTGWAVLFALWLAHLGLTGIIGWFVWRHVRRTRLRVMPPKHWMIVLGVVLVVLSTVVPAELLGRSDFTRLVPDLPLDPFVLFLLPLLGAHPWLVLLGFLVALVVTSQVPRWFRVAHEVVTLDPDACTGCELCVPDCPYEALTMTNREAPGAAEDHEPAHATVAVLDASACVGCGICVGSCVFGALTLPGLGTAPSVDPEGRSVVLVCARHARGAQVPDEVLLVEVPCSGAIEGRTIAALEQAGAASIQIIGCPPGDCSFGTGNVILSARLAGERKPHVARRYASATTADWVSPGQVAEAIAHPGGHPSADPESVPTSTRQRVAAGLVVAGSMGAVALATQAPFRTDHDQAVVRVIVQHTPGQQLVDHPGVTGAPGAQVSITVSADGSPQEAVSVDRDGVIAMGVVDVEVPRDTTSIIVTMEEGASPTVLFDGPVELDAGERLVLTAIDVPPPPGAAEGKEVFEDRSQGACDVCHTTDGGRLVGPSLEGVAVRAETRVPGMSARDYLVESILDPEAYVVEGYRGDQMLPIYRERLDDAQIEALVTYLLTLRGES